VAHQASAVPVLQQGSLSGAIVDRRSRKGGVGVVGGHFIEPTKAACERRLPGTVTSPSKPKPSKFSTIRKFATTTMATPSDTQHAQKIIRKCVLPHKEHSQVSSDATEHSANLYARIGNLTFLTPDCKIAMISIGFCSQTMRSAVLCTE